MKERERMCGKMLLHEETQPYCRSLLSVGELPNSVLEPGYPRRVSAETARKWLHELGFDVLQMLKGVFIDGHERPDSREK